MSSEIFLAVLGTALLHASWNALVKKAVIVWWLSH